MSLEFKSFSNRLLAASGAGSEGSSATVEPNTARAPRWTRLLLLWVCLLPMAAVLAEEGFAVSASPALSSDGVVRLTWSGGSGQPVEIERAESASFDQPRLLYRGTDGATVISGLSNGRYFFRGRVHHADGNYSPWSRVAVEVEHHSLARALGFFALGSFVFLATLILIISGSRRVERDVR